MSIYDSKCWIEDLKEAVGSLQELKELEGRTVMITGATGLIGSAIIDILIQWNTMNEGKIGIIATGRRIAKIASRFSPFFDKEWFRATSFDATNERIEGIFSCDYIIHAASNASPDLIMSEPVETMLSNIVGVKNLLDYAKQEKVTRVLFVSSSEVYGKKDDGKAYKEDEHGYINLLDVRNSYAVSKCAAETICVSYAKEYGVDSVIVRPGHIYGPTAKKSDSRVSSKWAFEVARNEDIVMLSDGAQIRSYCHCLDCSTAIIKVLLRGESGKAYNIANPDSVISIRRLAEILAEQAGVTVQRAVPTEESRKAFNPMSNSSLDSSALQALSWKGLFPPERGLSHTVQVIRELIQDRDE